eukprot:scaffold2601_cov117-Isochrysis_galbana.AAC.10
MRVCCAIPAIVAVSMVNCLAVWVGVTAETSAPRDGWRDNRYDVLRAGGPARHVQDRVLILIGLGGGDHVSDVTPAHGPQARDRLAERGRAVRAVGRGRPGLWQRVPVQRGGECLAGLDGLKGHSLDAARLERLGRHQLNQAGGALALAKPALEGLVQRRAEGRGGVVVVGLEDRLEHARLGEKAARRLAGAHARGRHGGAAAAAAWRIGRRSAIHVEGGLVRRV